MDLIHGPSIISISRVDKTMQKKPFTTTEAQSHCHRLRDLVLNPEDSGMNPVLLADSPLTACSALTQYSLFVLAMPDMIGCATNAAMNLKWRAIETALHDLLSLELGVWSSGIPYNVITAEYFRKAGISWPGDMPCISQYTPGMHIPRPNNRHYSGATYLFMERLSTWLALGNAGKRVGIALGLVTLAEKERTIIAKIYNLAVRGTTCAKAPPWALFGDAPPEGTDPLTLDGMLAQHPPGYSDALWDAVRKHGRDDLHDITKGYLQVVETKHAWWDKLAKRQ